MKQFINWLKINILPLFVDLLSLLKILMLFVLFYAGLLFIVKNLNKELSEQILEYLKIISWPLVIIIISFQFNNEIKNLINRIKSIEGPGCLKFNIKSPDQTIKPIKESENIKDTNIDVVDDKKEEELSLKNQVKSLQDVLYYEKIYSIVYGSQIELLEKLRLNSNGIVYQDIAAYYQQKRIIYPSLNSYSLEKYLDFLKTSNLAEFLNESGKYLCKITTTGINFLDYIETNNYLKLKRF